VFDADVAAAAVLTEGGFCSDCRVKAMWAAGRDMRVCPACYSLLWHRDWIGEDRARAAAATAIAAERTAAARREKRRRRDGITAAGEGSQGDGGVQAKDATFGERLRAAREIAEASHCHSDVGGVQSGEAQEAPEVAGGDDGEEAKEDGGVGPQGGSQDGPA
jgi:hypothetical protein